MSQRDEPAPAMAPYIVQRRLDIWVLAAVGMLGATALCTQLALMREMLAALGGSEMVLGIILGCWLLLTGLGAWAGRASDRLKDPAALLIVGLMLVAVLPLAQVLALRTLRDVVFTRGATVGLAETIVSALVLLLPFCVVSGGLLTLASGWLSRRGALYDARPCTTRGLGRVYVADSVGSIAGGVAFSFLLIRWLDHFALLAVPALINLLLACLLAAHFRRRVLWAVAGVAAAGLALLVLTVDVDAWSTARQFPGQRIVFRGNSPYGRLVVTQSADSFTSYNFIENGLPIVSTDSVGQAEETVHYAMAQRPDAASVLLIGGSISGTAREVLKYGVHQVTCVELDPLMIRVGQQFLGYPGRDQGAPAEGSPIAANRDWGPLSRTSPPTASNRDEGRVTRVNTDGRLFVRLPPLLRLPAGPSFDVVIVDMPDPSTSQINRFYTAEFFAEVKRILADGGCTRYKAGVLAIGLGHYENYVSRELGQMVASVDRSLRRSFANVRMVPGGRVYFLASDGPVDADIAARLEQRSIATRLVGRHYLDAMLTADRLDDLARAAAQPAEVNEDFNPVLYFYHLQYWASQFKARFGLLAGVGLAALAVYLARIRPAPLAIFASGFAASTLEVALLLAVQVLYGSLYQQVGLIVTTFMAGLAGGALLGNRFVPGTTAAEPPGRSGLAALALAVAVFAAALPAALAGVVLCTTRLSDAGTVHGSTFVGHGAIVALTFLLAGVVGMQFPLAGRAVEATGHDPAAAASKVFVADFVGASLGALLASTLLIPLLGLTVVCLLTAGLNLFAGAVLLGARARH